MACERHTVGRWRQRYLAHGLNGLGGCPALGPATACFPPLSASRCCRWRPGTRPRILVPPPGGVLMTWSQRSSSVASYLPVSSSIWRILEEADRKPHRSVYWLNSHDPDFEAKAHALCQLYVHALRFYQPGRLVICADEKTGRQISATPLSYPASATWPARRKTRARVYSPWRARLTGLLRVVPTGHLVWHTGPDPHQCRWGRASGQRCRTPIARYAALRLGSEDNLHTH